MRDPTDWPMLGFFLLSNMGLVPAAVAGHLAPPTPAIDLVDFPDRGCFMQILLPATYEDPELDRCESAEVGTGVPLLEGDVQRIKEASSLCEGRAALEVRDGQITDVALLDGSCDAPLLGMAMESCSTVAIVQLGVR
jgi:hypothetical protein